MIKHAPLWKTTANPFHVRNVLINIHKHIGNGQIDMISDGQQIHHANQTTIPIFRLEYHDLPCQMPL